MKEAKNEGYICWVSYANHTRFDEGVLEIGYGRDIVTLPKETGRNREYKFRPVATTPVALLYQKKVAYLLSEKRVAKFKRIEVDVERYLPGK